MATSSLTKDFVVGDKKAFAQFKKDIETMPENDRTVKSCPSLKRGKEKLKYFSFQSKEFIKGK